MNIKYVNVYNRAIAAMMVLEGYPFLGRDDDQPYCFIGDEAIERALHWDKYVNIKVPVDLTVKELIVLHKLMEDNPVFCAMFGVSDCGDKLKKALFDKSDKNNTKT